MTVIPILLYHGVNSSPSSRLEEFTVTPEAFGAHLDVLTNGDFVTMTVSDMVDRLTNATFESTVAGRRVALVTFDDGWADFADNAQPAMHRHGISSTLYVTTGFVSGDVDLPDEKVLGWDQIRDLDAAGVEIGAHSHTHPQMDTLLPGRAWEEFVRSKAILEDATGKKVRSFAYPHGYNSAHLRKQARLAGFDSAVAVRNMFSHAGDERFAMARLTVTAQTTIDDIEAWVYGEGAPTAPKGESCKTKIWRSYRLAKALVTNTTGNEYTS